MEAVAFLRSPAQEHKLLDRVVHQSFQGEFNGLEEEDGEELIQIPSAPRNFSAQFFMQAQHQDLC